MGGGVTATSYTGTPGGGGGGGYFNLGGWNTTLTAADATAQEVCGIRRQDGCNTYLYAYQSTDTATAAGTLMILATNVSDTNGIVPAVTLTGNTAAGTANQFLVKAVTVATRSAATYGWYLVEGYTTIRVSTNTVSATLQGFACVSEHSANAWVGGVTGASAQARVFTTIACDTLGQAYVKFGNL